MNSIPDNSFPINPINGNGSLFKTGSHSPGANSGESPLIIPFRPLEKSAELGAGPAAFVPPPLHPANNPVSTGSQPVDTVEISEEGSRLAFSNSRGSLSADALPADAMERVSMRLARTNAIKAEIAAGTYETPERLAGTVERLLDELI